MTAALAVFGESAINRRSGQSPGHGKHLIKSFYAIA
jgi:hypothetical protein